MATSGFPNPTRDSVPSENVAQGKEAHQGDDANLELYKQEVGWFEKVTKLKRYFRTRRLIIQGENLFDLADFELKLRDLMAPLPFNTYQTILSAIPTYVIAWLISLWRPATQDSAFFQIVKLLAEQSDTAAAARQMAFLQIFPKLQSIVGPLVTPTVLLVGSWAYAWTILKREDTNRTNRKRAARAHLYFDGTYGLWPEAVAILFATFVIPNLVSWDAPTLSDVPFKIWIYFYWGYVLLYRVQNPRTVLRVFGYQSTQDENDNEIITIGNPGPALKEYSWFRGLIGAVIVGIICALCDKILLWAQIIAAYALAYLATALKIRVT